MRKCQAVFQSGCVIFQFHHQCLSYYFPSSLPTLVMFRLFEYSSPHGYKQCLCDFGYIYLRTDDFEYLFICLSIICKSFQKYLFKSFVTFELFTWIVKGFLIWVEVLSDMWYINILSHWMGRFFIFMIVSFEALKF